MGICRRFKIGTRDKLGVSWVWVWGGVNGDRGIQINKSINLPAGRQVNKYYREMRRFRMAKTTRLTEFLESVLASRFERCLSTVRWLMMSFSAIC